MKGLRKFMGNGGGLGRMSLSYYSPDVDARWTFDLEDDESLQLVYQRKSIGPTYDPETKGPKENPDENFWLYLAPHDAAVIGAALMAWAASHGKKA
jgi:hypothetical protein